MCDSERSITKAIRNQDHDTVVNRSFEEFKQQWLTQAERFIPPNRRRSAAAEDVLQDMIESLWRELSSEEASFTNRESILRWGMTVIRNKAIDVGRKNSRLEGPSAIGQTEEDDRDANSLLGEAAGERVPREYSCEDEEIVQRTNDLISQLRQAIVAELESYDQSEHAILTSWLKWTSYRELEEKSGCKMSQLRRLTFDFKSSQAISAFSESLRHEISEVYKDVAFFTRFDIFDDVCRVLADQRTKPY